MCTGSASWFWRQVLHLPQLRRLFAPGSHLTGEQLLALVLALFIRHRLTAGHPDLTATGALDFSTAGGASGTNPPESRNTPARRPGFCRYEAIVLRLFLLCAVPDRRCLAAGVETGDRAAGWPAAIGSCQCWTAVSASM